jgi:hypothetical protein
VPAGGRGRPARSRALPNPSRAPRPGRDTEAVRPARGREDVGARPQPAASGPNGRVPPPAPILRTRAPILRTPKEVLSMQSMEAGAGRRRAAPRGGRRPGSRAPARGIRLREVESRSALRRDAGSPGGSPPEGIPGLLSGARYLRTPLGQPVPEEPGDGFRPFVPAEPLRPPVLGERPLPGGGEEPPGAGRGPDLDRRALPTGFINPRQDAQPLAVGALILEGVVRPDVVGAPGSDRHRVPSARTPPAGDPSPALRAPSPRMRGEGEDRPGSGTGIGPAGGQDRLVARAAAGDEFPSGPGRSSHLPVASAGARRLRVARRATGSFPTGLGT